MDRQDGCRAVIFARDCLALAEFYRNVAVMRELSRAEDHVVLLCGAFRLIVHQIPERYAKDIAVRVPPVVRERTSIKLCFPVADLARARETAARLGGALYGPEREWRDESSILCDGYDPEGNVFQLCQPRVA